MNDTYRKAIFIVHKSRRFLEAVYTKPKNLEKALRLMQAHNPNRVYEVDDPERS